MKSMIKKIINIISGIFLTGYVASDIISFFHKNTLGKNQLLVTILFLILYLVTCSDLKYTLLPLWKRFLRIVLFPLILFTVFLSFFQIVNILFNESTEISYTIPSVTDPTKMAVVYIICMVVLIAVYIRLFNPISNISRKKLDTMEGHDFEQYCAEVLKRNGFTDIQVTQGSSDYGADIVARKRGRKWVIQCKRYQSVVGSTPIQEITAAMRYYHAKKAAVITNSTFTANAVRLAKVNGVVLINGDDLMRMSKH